MSKNRERRKKRMMRQGIVPVQCDIVENEDFEKGEGIIRNLRARRVEQVVAVKNIELGELPSKEYLRRSPLENNPSTAMSYLRTNLGNRVSTEIFEYYENLMRGEEKKLDNFETWTTPIIKIWMRQREMERNDCIVKWKIRDVMELKKWVRERLVAEWMQASNVGI